MGRWIRESYQTPYQDWMDGGSINYANYFGIDSIVKRGITDFLSRGISQLDGDFRRIDLIIR